MNYQKPGFYRSFVESELKTTIEPAINNAGGKILAAVHLGSTVNNPPLYKVWDIIVGGKY